MIPMKTPPRLLSSVLLPAVLCATGSLSGQEVRSATQRLDEEYTQKILDLTPDPRMEIDLVNHMPLAPDVPSPLEVLGYIPGEGGNLTYSEDIYAYIRALDAASPRVLSWSIGETEEGRDTLAVAVSDEETIRNLQAYKAMTAQLTDPRNLTEEQAKNLIKTAKPIYWATGAIHSTERSSPEMLMELGYRLAISEGPFFQTIRDNLIFVFTPMTEVDGRDRQVDNQRAQRAGEPPPSMVYWGKYVAHDNNRDGIGKGLKLSQNVLAAFLDLHPQVLLDLHESVNLLYVSTGTGPYNPIVDPIQVNEWWILAQNEILELTKKGVPGVWTYNYYDGWVPNYMFWIGASHNAIGRFYETQSGRETTSTPGAQSREWYRPNPNPGDVLWNMRSNINMQQSGVLTSLNFMARNREMFLENYYLKMKNQVRLGKTEAPHAYVIPVDQRKKSDLADLVNIIRREGAEISIARESFMVGDLQVNAGDYVGRMDQPYRGIIEMYMGLQWYPPDNPRPYDDTGWAIPLLHNIRVHRVDDPSILEKSMVVMDTDAVVEGAISGSGSTIVIDHTTDNALATFRWANVNVEMSAAEEAFELAGHEFTPGAFVIQNANRAALESQIRDMGLQAWATDTVPDVPMHSLDLPRVGYIHSWQNTQDEGWVRMGLDMYDIPYTYFGDNEVRNGDLRSRFDVILYPNSRIDAESNGPPVGGQPQPYRATAATPTIATAPDQTDDRRGGLGRDGLRELQRFVEEGGVLITEGGTSATLIEYSLAPGVRVAETDGLYVPGSVIKTLLGDKSSPILYGYDQDALAVLIKNGPVLSAGGGGRGGRGRGLPPGVGGGNLSPMAAAARLTTLEGGPAAGPPGTGRGGRGTQPTRGGTRGARGGTRGARGGRGGRGGGRGGRGGGGNANPMAPRVLLSYPDDPEDLLLSGMLVGGENLAGNAVLVDASLGEGHVVLFANRPFWRNEPHGNYFLWFNAMLNWNDLGAGR